MSDWSLWQYGILVRASHTGQLGWFHFRNYIFRVYQGQSTSETWVKLVNRWNDIHFRQIDACGNSPWLSSMFQHFFSLQMLKCSIQVPTYVGNTRLRHLEVSKGCPIPKDHLGRGGDGMYVIWNVPHRTASSFNPLTIRQCVITQSINSTFTTWKMYLVESSAYVLILSSKTRPESTESDHSCVIHEFRVPEQQQLYSWPEAAIAMGTEVLPELEPLASTALTTSIPSITRPKTTWAPSSQSVLTVVRKNWEPLLEE